MSLRSLPTGTIHLIPSPRPVRLCRSNADQRGRSRTRSSVFQAGTRTAHSPRLLCHKCLSAGYWMIFTVQNKAVSLRLVTGTSLYCHNRSLLARQSHPSHYQKATLQQTSGGRGDCNKLGLVFALLPSQEEHGISLPRWVKRVFQSRSPPISHLERFAGGATVCQQCATARKACGYRGAGTDTDE